MLHVIKSVGKKPSIAPKKFEIYEFGGDRWIVCPVRKKTYKVTDKPEEVVRQWWLYRLVETYGYDFDQIGVEVPVIVGSTEAKKKADIVVYTNPKKTTPRVFIEVKEPARTDGIEQLKVYMNATGCSLGAWSNGTTHAYLLRINPKVAGEEPDWRELRNVPGKSEKLADVDTPLLRKELEPTTDFLSVIRECEKLHQGT